LKNLITSKLFVADKFDVTFIPASIEDAWFRFPETSIFNWHTPFVSLEPDRSRDQAHFNNLHKQPPSSFYLSLTLFYKPLQFENISVTDSNTFN